MSFQSVCKLKSFQLSSFVPQMPKYGNLAPDPEFSENVKLFKCLESLHIYASNEPSMTLQSCCKLKLFQFSCFSPNAKIGKSRPRPPNFQKYLKLFNKFLESAPQYASNEPSTTFQSCCKLKLFQFSSFVPQMPKYVQLSTYTPNRVSCEKYCIRLKRRTKFYVQNTAFDLYTEHSLMGKIQPSTYTPNIVLCAKYSSRLIHRT